MLQVVLWGGFRCGAAGAAQHEGGDGADEGAVRWLAVLWRHDWRWGIYVDGGWGFAGIGISCFMLGSWVFAL